MREGAARKHPRLKAFDYSRGGAYFVTVCTKDRERILGQISPVGPDDLIGPRIRLSSTGETVDRYIRGIGTAYSRVTVEHYAVMPNHIHLLLRFDTPEDGRMGSSGPTLGMVIRGMKRMITRELGRPIFQSSFYEHVVRDEKDFLTRWTYIDQNPARWAEDEYYTE